MSASTLEEVIWRGVKLTARRLPLAVKEVCGVLESTQESTLPPRSELLAHATQLLLDRRTCLCFAAATRAVLLHLMSMLHRHGAAAVAHAPYESGETAVAITFLRLGLFLPHVKHLVYLHVRDHIGLLRDVVAGLPGSDGGAASLGASQDLMVCIQAMQLMPEVSISWDKSCLFKLLNHQSAIVRWCAVEGLRLSCGWSDALSSRLRGQLMTEEEVVEAAGQWQDTLTAMELERLPWWCGRDMPKPGDLGPPAWTPGEGFRGALESLPSAQLTCGLPAPEGYTSICGLHVSCRPHAAPPPPTATGPPPHPFVQTSAMSDALLSCALALCQDQPLVLEGPPGCGKTALVEELARLSGQTDSLVWIHLDDQMDAKSLLGSYTCTQVPGEFSWQPGPLTQAVRKGCWVVFENIQSAPPDVLAAVTPLIKQRSLVIATRGEEIKAAQGFQLIATVTTSPTQGSSSGAYVGARQVRELLGSCWRYVHLRPPTWDQSFTILEQCFPHLRPLLTGALATLSLVHLATGQSQSSQNSALTNAGSRDPGETLAVVALRSAGVTPGDLALHVGRHFSLRDVIKWSRRMSSLYDGQLRALAGANVGGSDIASLDVGIRQAAFVEFSDCLVGMISKQVAKEKVLRAVCALWGLPEDVIELHERLHKPEIKESDRELQVGRGSMAVVKGFRTGKGGSSMLASAEALGSFSFTGYASRVLQRVTVALMHQEPLLLVGETGVGKTTMVSRLAAMTGHKLVAFNLSQQTDSSDLLGGYKPVEGGEVLLQLLSSFQDLVRQTWTTGKNEEFLHRVSKFAEKKKWHQLLNGFKTAISKVEGELGGELKEKKGATSKVDVAQGDNAGEDRPKKRRKTTLGRDIRERWKRFQVQVSESERAMAIAAGGFAFAFVEGALVRALREGWWLLLDEINLAPTEVLERLAGLLDGERGSVTLVERGDTAQVSRHPDFRILAAMNPATDAGKHELPSQLRNRFTEFWVSEPPAREDLKQLVGSYLQGVGPQPPIDPVVDFYLTAKAEAQGNLTDSGGGKPAYNLRTLARALDYARTLTPSYGLQRALYDGVAMSFMTQLDPSSDKKMAAMISKFLLPGVKNIKSLLRTPPCPSASPDSHVLFEHFWLERGPLPLPEAGSNDDGFRRTFVLTPSVRQHLCNLARAVTIRKHPILLQGPTSSGKTSLVAYLAAQTGHPFVRINNHEHTDLQEYLGSYVSDESGKLVFKEGALVTALRQGHWVVLDELNLAPTEVLEALNRLLDDNRELFVPELQEVVKPHPHFMLFATQNPPGAYAGRKQLSQAFRSRFLELHIEDIPDSELATILEQRCLIPASYASKMVTVMRELQRRRQRSHVFAGKHGFITPRDLFRWAERQAQGYQELAQEGYMLLAERLRSEEEKREVAEVLEKVLRVKLDMDTLYCKEGDAPLAALKSLLSSSDASLVERGMDPEEVSALKASLTGVVWTSSMRRMYTLVERCVRHEEPVLLVGETGTGKTTVCQLLAFMRMQRLHILNCNMHTETADFLGGFRPSRNRDADLARFCSAALQVMGSPLFKLVQLAVPEVPPQVSPVEVPTLMLDIQQAVEKLKSQVKVSQTSGVWPGCPAGISVEEVNQQLMALELSLKALSDSSVAARAPFAWVDGPLVVAMRHGDLLLIDEVNLAEDAVLERLNSVLEPGRTLTLAERGGEGAEVVKAATGFRVLATMNPGGDFGKKELSPALTNRFTQIWVPALSDEQELQAILEARLAEGALKLQLVSKLLDFWRFFQSEVAATARTVLSIRDLLAWVRFINTTSQTIGPLAAYVHGVYLTLLDGLGVGAGVNALVAEALKGQCYDFIQSQLPKADKSVAVEAAGKLHQYEESVLPGQWGIAPFFVPTCSPCLPSSSLADYHLSCPTPSRNAMRILRALQLPKAILLEGSPGVGKTSMVAALAKKAGRELVRINLSDQTDMMDLLGADLPADGGEAGQFVWCDGPLLTAIKKGHWVLLDELNLASQAVLEGLNALLDHRGEVFLPELSATFRCHPNFRLFAAQNPLQEGGGRKGLPKSFLNRFSRVQLEALQQEDLESIAGSSYPGLPKDVVAKMVQFLEHLQSSASSTQGFAVEGGPWEFNLRDLLRWCELTQSGLWQSTASKDHQGRRTQVMMELDSPAAETEAAAGLGSSADKLDHVVERLCHLLFVQRMRSARDRSVIRNVFIRVWGRPMGDFSQPSVVMSPGELLVGETHLTRRKEDAGRHTAEVLVPEDQDLRLLDYQLCALEAMACSVAAGWMTLLVGPGGSGKSSLVRLMAQMMERPLLQLSLSPGTDTGDLLGSFEQIEPQRKVTGMLKSIHSLLLGVIRDLLDTAPQGLSFMNLVDEVVLPLHGCQERLAKVNPTTQNTPAGEFVRIPDHGLRGENLMILIGSVQRDLSRVVSLLEKLASAPREVSRLQVACQQLHQLGLVLKSIGEAEGKRHGAGFEWVDGALTTAIEEGSWVLLDSANLCNPSVLDRLNPLLEPNGKLYLNEAGTPGGQPRTVHPHPDFRLFLALDPSHGEVSRAMRNRGMEVFILTPTPGQNQAEGAGKLPEITMKLSLPVNPLAPEEAVLMDSGVLGTEVVQAMAEAHRAMKRLCLQSHIHAPGLSELRNWATVTTCLVERGGRLPAGCGLGWYQAYVLGLACEGSLLQQSQAVFQDLCWDLNWSTADAEGEEMKRMQEDPARQVARWWDVALAPAAWPVRMNARLVSAASIVGAVQRDLALLQFLWSQMLAGVLEVYAPEGSQLTALTPTQMSMLPSAKLLHIVSALGPWDGEVVHQTLGGIQPQDLACITWYCAMTCISRSRLADLHILAAWSKCWYDSFCSMLEAVGKPTGCLLASASLVSKYMSTVLEHPLVTELCARGSMGLSWELLGGQGEVMGGAGRGTMTGAEWLWLLQHQLVFQVLKEQAEEMANAAVLSGQASHYQISFWRYNRPRERARREAGHPCVDHIYSAVNSLAILEARLVREVFLQYTSAGDISRTPLNLIRQVQDFQAARQALWSTCHKSLTNSIFSLDKLGFQGADSMEDLTFSWSRMVKFCNTMAAAVPEVTALAEWASCSQRAQQLTQALGLDRTPDKPLLWRYGGHPILPGSADILEACQRSVDLCPLVTWVGAEGLPGSSWRSTWQQLLGGGRSSEDELGLTVVEDELVLQAVTAGVSCDGKLKRSLLEGCSLVTFLPILEAGKLAKVQREAQQPGHGGSAEERQHAADVVNNVGGWQQSVQAVELMASEIRKRVSELQKLMGNVHSQSLGHSGGTTSTAGGELGYVLPAAMMITPEGRALQTHLMALNDVTSLRSYASLLLDIGSLFIAGQSAQTLKSKSLTQLVERLRRDLLFGLTATGRSPEDFIALQHLIWILQALQDGQHVVNRKVLLREVLASILQLAWYRHHVSIWKNSLVSLWTPSSDHQAVVEAEPQLRYGPGVVYRASQSWSIYRLVNNSTANVSTKNERVAQLRSAARSILKSTAGTQRQLEGNAVNLILMVVQILIAHAPSFSDPDACKHGLCDQEGTSEGSAAHLWYCMNCLLGIEDTANDVAQLQGESIWQRLPRQQAGRKVLDALTLAIQRSSHQGLRRCYEAFLLPVLSSLLLQDGPLSLSRIGRAWVLVGAARLQLVQPPPGVDPAAKYNMKADQLNRRIEDVLMPQIQAHLLLDQLPWGPSEQVALENMYQEYREATRKLKDMQARSVPRPSPPRYASLQNEVRAFGDGLGQTNRLVELVAGLDRSSMEAVQQAMNWCDNAGAWVDSLGVQYKNYVDVVQPVQLAVQEIRHGLALMSSDVVAAHWIGAASSQLQLVQTVATLQSYPSRLIGGQTPSPSHRTGACGPDVVNGIPWVREEVWKRLVMILEGPKDLPRRSSQGSPNHAVNSADLQLLLCRASLHAAAQELFYGLASPVGDACTGFDVLTMFDQVLERLTSTWRHIKEAEAAAAEEAAQEFKTKVQSSTFMTEEEEEELTYHQQYPDHYEAFKDVAEEDGDNMMMEDEDTGTTTNDMASGGDQKTSGEATKSLVQGALLEDVVSIHREVYALLAEAQVLRGSSAADEINDDDRMASRLTSFQICYQLGAQVVQAVQGCLPEELDSMTYEGHLLSVCLEAKRVSQSPATSAAAAAAAQASPLTSSLSRRSRSEVTALQGATSSLEAVKFDIQQAAVEEVTLMLGPVRSMQARLAVLLEEWPDHPLLKQLDAICSRLLSLPLNCPLKQALTGVELLLSRAQLWQETAAKHVSLEVQLSALAAVATRWRQLELLSWKALLQRVVHKHACAAHQHWFHLYDLLMGAVTGGAPGVEGGGEVTSIHGGSNSPVELAYLRVTSTLEAFLQTSTQGEFSARLELLEAFRMHLLVGGTAVSGDGSCSSTPGEVAHWKVYASSLSNLHQYYSQFLPAMRDSISKGLAPLEKDLAGFVQLAKWEDRGYYSMRSATEKAQRYLHRLSRRAEDVLKQPAALVLSSSSKALGLAQLSGERPTFSSTEERAGVEGHPGPKQRVKQGMKELDNQPLSELLEVSFPLTHAKWQVFSKQAIAVANDSVARVSDMSAHSLSSVVAGLKLEDAGLYYNQTSHLTSRLVKVLSCLVPERILEASAPDHQDKTGSTVAAAEVVPVSAGQLAVDLDEMSSGAIQRAEELKMDVAKGARQRKKKGLTDLLKTLGELGVSRRLADVPADEREVSSWFKHSPPGLDTSGPVSRGPGKGSSPLSDEHVALAQRCWTKADEYYFRGIATVQKLLESAKSPHPDLVPYEVQGAARLSTHLLYLVRCQRAVLSKLREQYDQLSAASNFFMEWDKDVKKLTTEGSPGVGVELQTKGATLEALMSMVRQGPLPDQRLTRKWFDLQQQSLTVLVRDLVACKDVLTHMVDVKVLPLSTARPRHLLTLVSGHLHLALECKRSLEEARAQRSRRWPLGHRILQVLIDNYNKLSAMHESVAEGVSSLQLGSAEEEMEEVKVPGWSRIASCLNQIMEDREQLRSELTESLANLSGQQDQPSLVDQTLQAFSQELHLLMKSMLIWAQSKGSPREAQEEASLTIPEVMKQLEAFLSLEKLSTMYNRLVGIFQYLVGESVQTRPQGQLTGLDLDFRVADGQRMMAVVLVSVFPLLEVIRGSLEVLAAEYLVFHKSCCKLLLVCASIFSTLLQDGYCMPKETDGQAEEGKDGPGEFKEAEGTGMGEGEGKKDVSDQIQDEDQLLGAQAEGQKEGDEKPPEPQAEENVKGVEMDQDFDGELYDVDQKEDDDGEQQEEEDNQERLEQQMGDVGENEEVVDEQLWGKDDDDKAGEDGGKKNEKYEKDAPVEVEDKSNLEYMAGGEEEEKKEQADTERESKKSEPVQEEKEMEELDQEGGSDMDEEGAGVNDMDDQYEDRHAQPPEAPEAALELPEDLNLDGEEGDGGEEGEQPEANEEEKAGQAGEESGPQEQGNVEDFPKESDLGGEGQEELEEDNKAQEQDMDLNAADGGEDQQEQGQEGADKQEEGPEGGQVAQDEAGPEDDDKEAPVAPTGHQENEGPAPDPAEQAGPQGQETTGAPTPTADTSGVATTVDDAMDDKEEAAGKLPQEAQALGDPDTNPPQQEAAEAAQKSTMGVGSASAGGAPTPMEKGPSEKPQGSQPRSKLQQEPNPLRNLGDVLKRWQANLTISHEAPSAEEKRGKEGGKEGEDEEDGTGEDEVGGGEFQFMGADDDDAGGTQALGPATEDQVKELPEGEEGNEEGGGNDEVMPDDVMNDVVDEEEEEVEDRDMVAAGAMPQSLKAGNKKAQMVDKDPGGEKAVDEAGPLEDGAEGALGGLNEEEDVGVDDELHQSMVRLTTSDQERNEKDEDHALTSRLTEEEAQAVREEISERMQRAQGGGASSSDGDMAYGRAMWQRCEALTSGLSLELTEQLRLVLEATQASRLAGDFKTGKRINMKKVIGYIASQFRKDKIWMRRSRPDKRRYQVMLVVDNSRSMAENKCGVFALEALCLISRALARLEVGELGVLSFGGPQGARPLQLLEAPFSDASGPQLMSQLKFDQDNTIADRPMQELITCLDEILSKARHRASQRSLPGASQDLQQLVLIIADGRFHEKDSLHAAVRDLASKKGVCLACLALDNHDSSLVEMQTVSFSEGKPVFTKYLDSFPFPYYVLLRDIAALPRTLADLIKQWFELSRS